jgi:non-ribosomal peptide synthetase component E (peptide arylation enzyme)
MFEFLAGAPPYRVEDAENYLRRGWWSGLVLGDLLDRAAGVHPDKEAFVDRLTRLTYAEVREKADPLASGATVTAGQTRAHIQPKTGTRMTFEAVIPQP